MYMYLQLVGRIYVYMFSFIYVCMYVCMYVRMCYIQINIQCDASVVFGYLNILHTYTLDSFTRALCRMVCLIRSARCRASTYPGLTQTDPCFFISPLGMKRWYVCMYVCMYMCHIFMQEDNICVYSVLLCKQLCVCMFDVCMYICMYVCMYVCDLFRVQAELRF